MPAASASSPRSTASRAREIVLWAIDALKAVWHRGAVDADGKTGDGAGIHVADAAAISSTTMCSAIGHELCRPAARGRHDLPAAHRPRRAGNLPHHRRDARSSTPATTIYGWRQVPVDFGVIGEKANATRPEIEQIMIANAEGRQRRRVRDAISISSAAASRSAVAAEQHQRTSISARCRAARSSTRACSWPSSCRPSIPTCRTSVSCPRRDLPPALFDQHLPDLAPGAAVPHARP